MITPHEFRQLAAGDAEIEAQLDKLLVQHAALTPDQPVRIIRKLLGTHEAVERVLVAYRAKGWRAEIISDIRDGDYVEMVP